MNSKKEAVQSLEKWKKAYFFTLIILLVIYVFYTAYSVTFQPEPRYVLLNNYDAIYQVEDLSTTSVSEGQVKQIIHDTLEKTFSFNFLNFRSQDDYQIITNKKGTLDLPDHRDKIRNLYSEEMHGNVIDGLLKAEWIRKLYVQRKKVTPYMSTPPVRKSISADWVLSTDGRLNAEYTGFLYVISKSKGHKTSRFRVDYEIKMERKPNFSTTKMPEYFFAPLVPHNNNEWGVKAITWTVERKQ
jgi:hypothetical protein